MTERIRLWLDNWFRGDGIHPWRWRALALWIIVFTVITLLALRTSRDTAQKNKKAIADLQQTKANISQLQNSNCALKGFLITAEIARFKSAKDKTKALDDRANDLRAAEGYHQLATIVTGVGDNCALPKEPTLPKGGT